MHILQEHYKEIGFFEFEVIQCKYDLVTAKNVHKVDVTVLNFIP